ncbi:MAG: hypothetical protein WBB32_07915 [Flavobacteriales bacterium]
MFSRIIFSAGLAFLGQGTFAQGPCEQSRSPSDSVAIVEAIRRAEPWIADQLDAMKTSTDPAEVQARAMELSQRTDSLARQFRKVFPDNDEGWMLFGMYSGLAAASDACAPGLAAVYRASAAAALFSGDSPYRPEMYQALNSISEQAWSLARAKRPERSQRLLEKLTAEYLDLIFSL